jgi:hypothetical protein
MATAKQTKDAMQEAGSAHEEITNVVVEETASVAPGRFFTIPGRDPFANRDEHRRSEVFPRAAQLP